MCVWEGGRKGEGVHLLSRLCVGRTGTRLGAVPTPVAPVTGNKSSAVGGSCDCVRSTPSSCDVSAGPV